MSKADETPTDARRQAQALLDRSKAKEPDWMAEREKQRRAEAAKTARLRELRLAKEAAEKQVAKPTRVARRRKPS